MLLRLVVWVRIVCTSELSRALHSSDVSVWNSVWLPIQSIWAGMAKPWPCWNEQQPFRWFYWFYPIFFYCWKIIIMWIMERVNRWKIGHRDFFLLIYKLWFGENKKWKGERKKNIEVQVHQVQASEHLSAVPLLRKAGLCLGCNPTLPLSPPNRAFSHKIHSGTSSQVLHTLFARKKKSFISLKESLGFFRYFPL